MLPLLLVLLLLAATPAAAQSNLVVDATITNQTYTIQIDPGSVIELNFIGLTANIDPTTNTPVADNIALEFQDSAGNTIFIIFVKYNGVLVAHVPYLGITTDQIVGDWSQNPYLKVRYLSDRIQFVDSAGNIVFEAQGNMPQLTRLWAHTPDNTSQAFTAGTIEILVSQDYSAFARSAVDLINAFLPIVVTLMTFAIIIGFFTKILDSLGSLMRNMRV